MTAVPSTGQRKPIVLVDYVPEPTCSQRRWHTNAAM